MSYKYGPSIVTDGLVFYVDAANDKSYPGSGTTWSDLAGSNDGTLTNGPTFSSGNGGGIDLDGVNDYITLPTGVVPANTNITISFFAKNNYTSLATNKGIFAINGSTRFQFFLGGTTGGAHGRVGTYNGSSYGNSPAGYMQFPIGEIHEFALVIESGGGFKLYKDGALEASVTGITFTANGATYLGRYATSNVSNGDFTIYNVKIYDRALSDAEVSQNYNALKNRFI